MSMATRRRRTAPARSHEWVLPLAVALLLAQLAFRTWSAWSSWYFLDDLIFLRRFDEVSSWAYLMEPYNGHLMPGGKLVFWALGSVGSAQWWPAALFLVAGQAVASVACLWMLVTLFGRRWAIVPPFMLYLFLSLTTPAYMWFVAATQQLPLQVVLSIGVGAWVRYLRGEGRRWVAVTLGVLLAGMAFREKALLVLPILVFVSLFYFTHGGPLSRVRALRRQAAALLAVVALGVGYLLVYRERVPSQFSPVTPGLARDLAATMLGSTLPTGLVGGPWHWDNPSPPNSFAAPPGWAVTASWVVIGAVVAYIVLRRRNVWPAFLLFTGYVAGTYLLVLSARGTDLGPDLGTDTRYLSDIPIVLCLCLALATMELAGAHGSSRAREHALIARSPIWVSAALVACVSIGGVASSVGYVRPWHRSDAKAFFTTLQREVDLHGRVDLADRVLPEDVMSQLAAPSNNLSFLVPLVTRDAHFPEQSSSLLVVDDDGRLRHAKIRRVLASRPGKVAECGWEVAEAGSTIPLDGRAIDYFWWVRIAYLSTGPTTATVTLGDTSFDVSLRTGLNDLFLRVEDTFDSVRIDGLEPGVTVCVDTIEVGHTRTGDPA